MTFKLNAAERLQSSTEVEAAGFEDWSKERQNKYLREHPGSKYSKGYKPKDPSAKKPAAKKPPPLSAQVKIGRLKQEYSKIRQQIHDLSDQPDSDATHQKMLDKHEESKELLEEIRRLQAM